MRGTVTIPADYFLKMAKHDYSNYREALAREFYQNSIDAGATRIEVTTDPERRCIEVKDDGCGMDFDTLKHKLLVLGGSKKGDGAVGAFGKAKEVLFFSWQRYEIETQDWKVEGSAADYKIKRNCRTNGTVARIFIQKEEPFAALAAQFTNIAAKMETKAKLFVNGARIECKRRRGTLKKDLGWCAIYQVKCRDAPYMPVRVDGIWMFDRYVGLGQGELVLELKRSSLECLTSNRDSLKWEWLGRLEPFLADLQVNKRSALKDRSKDVFEKIKGSGRVKVSKQDAEEILSSIGKVEQEGATLEMLWASLKQELEQARVPAAKERAYTLARQMKDANDFFRYRDRIQFMGYEPDFIIKHEGAKAKVDRFMKTDKARVLAKIWTETVKQVLLDNEMYLEFTAGFTFNAEEEAEYVRRGDELYFLLNPTNIGKMGRRWLLMEEMKDRAIHEVAHHKVPDHNETFVLEMARIRRNTRESRDVYSKIGRL